MTILYNGQKYEIPDDFPFPREIQLDLAIASPDSPTWIPVVGALDTGCELPLAISKNVLAKHGIKTKPFKRSKVAVADGSESDAELVLLNVRVNGINALNTVLLHVPTLLLDLDDQIVLGSILFLFSTILKKGRIQLIGFDEKSIT